MQSNLFFSVFLGFFNPLERAQTKLDNFGIYNSEFISLSSQKVKLHGNSASNSKKAFDSPDHQYRK